MVQFGEKPSTGTLFRASQFLSEELPIRLAHRVQELNELPDGLNEMPSICRVRDWYAQSFEVCCGGLYDRWTLTHNHNRSS
jgi:pyruvate dehydrogenase kinase 2/3/4